MLQPLPRVGLDTKVDGAGLAELGGIDVEADEGLALDGGGRRGEACADGEDDVGLRDQVAAGAPAEGGDAAGELVALVDRALARGGGDDDGREALGEGTQLIGRAGAEDAAAGPDEGARGIGEELGGAGYVRFRGGGTGIVLGLGEGDVGGFGEDVGGISTSTGRGLPVLS